MKRNGTAFVLLAGILWGCISFFIKKLSTSGLDAMQICLIRMIVSAVLFTGVIGIADPGKLKVRIRDLWMFAGTGIISVVFFNITYFYTMIHSQASVAVVLLYTSPVFVMALSALLFREHITARKVIALAMTIMGCVLTAGLLGGDYRITPTAMLTGIGSGFFYALYSIFASLALKKYDTRTVTAYTFIFGAVGSLPIGKIGAAAQILTGEIGLVWWCIGIGVFCTVLPYFFYTKGLEHMEAGKASIVVAIEPIVGAVIGMTVFHESRSIAKITGIVLILCAIVLLNLKTGSTRKDSAA